MFKNIKKLRKIIQNYDKIMVLIETTPEKKKVKSYSMKGMPQSQVDFIEKRREGGK